MWKTSVVVAPASDLNAPAPLKGTWTENIKNAAAIGFDAVQFTINRPAEFDVGEATTALERFDIRASSIATGGGYAIDGICLGHRDQRNRRSSVERMKEHIDLAHALGGADVVVGLIRGKYADGGTADEYMSHYRNSLEECISHAQRKSVCLVHEAIGRTDSDVLRSIHENIGFINSFHSPNFRLHIDTHHMGLEETDFASAMLQARDLIAQVDVSDVDRAVPNGTRFDFPALLRVLARIGYQRYLVFEYRAQGNGIKEAKEGLEYIRSIS